MRSTNPKPGGLGAALAFMVLVNGAQQPRSGYSIKKRIINKSVLI